MRIGKLEFPPELLFLPGLVLVAAILILWSCYYHYRQKSDMETLAASRGWNFLGKDAAELRLWLAKVDTSRSRRPSNIILVEGPAEKVYLFNYWAPSKQARGSSEEGTACLAEGPDGQTKELVMIDRRSPVAGLNELEEKLVDNIVHVGGPEFQGRFMVRCHQPEVAAATVTSGVQEFLLRQTSTLHWYQVLIAGRSVLVTVTLPLKPEDWDELIGMTKRLRATLP